MVMNTSLNFLMIYMTGNEYCGALHLRFQFLNTFLQILRGSAATNIAVLCRYKYCCSLRLCFIL